MMLKKKVADIIARQATAVCLAHDERSIPCLVEMLKSDMLQDARGRYWCPKHRNRGELFNWAAKYNYPSLQFSGKMRYAIGVPGNADNRPFWETAVLMGKEDMIAAAMAMLQPLDEVTS